MRTRVDAPEPEPDGEEPEELAAWLAGGFGADEAMVWRRWRFSIARAEAWKRAGVHDGLHAAQWSTAKVGPATVRDWRDAGIGAPEAVRWHEFGYDLDAARSARRQGLRPEQAFGRGRQARAAGGISGRLRVTSSGALGGGGRPGELFRRFQDAGVNGRLFHGYLQHQWVDEQALAWAVQGIEAGDAYTWHELGLTPVEAGRLVLQGRTPGAVIREWWDTGIPLAEVADWIGAGLGAVEAVAQRAKGITAEQAAALRALRGGEQAPQAQGASSALPLVPQGPPGGEQLGPPPADQAAARAQIGDAFAGMQTLDERTNTVPGVEGGAALGDCLAEAIRRWAAGGATVTVHTVQFVNDHEARVSYSVAATGSRDVTLRDQPGRAVLVDGEWKVARETFCRLMQLAGVPCPPPEQA